MLVTLDTSHFEISLLNADALRNAVQIIQKQEYINGKKRQEQISKKMKIGNNISDIVCYNKMENYKENKKRRQRIEIEMFTYCFAWW